MTSPGFLSGGGEMGALMRAHDWSRTPLGPPERWPAPLQTAVSVCLGSEFPMLIWWGPQLVKLYNDRYRPILGDKHPAALGRPGAEVWPEIWDVIGPMLAGVMERGEATWSQDQQLLMNRSGYVEETYFTFSYSPIHGEDGRVAGIFTAVTETTEQVLGTRRLLALTRLADLTSQARTPEEATRGALAALAEAPADVPLAQLYVVEDGRPRLAGAVGCEGLDLAAIAAGTEEREVELEGLGPVARAVLLPVPPAATIVLGVNPRRALDDDYRSFFGVIARQLSAALARAEGLEAERARADALAELDRAKTEFFSNVSHEFRTPLMLMLGPLADALADPGGPQQERIELAHRSALRMLRLVNALLDFSRIEAGRAEPSFAELDVARVIRENASVFQAAAERAGLELRIDVPEGEHTIEADPDMLDKILLNLLSNAYKFTLDGAIEVRLRVGERAVIEVADTGVGIAGEVLPRLFERFHRVRGASGRSHEGSGIGLALVQELVELHGGEVSVTSTPAAGSTFRIELPLRQPVTAGGRRPDPELAEAQRQGYGQEALRWVGHDPDVTGDSGSELLVVDDNADMRAYLSRLLGERYRVRTAVDGEDALAKLAERTADLVVTDVMMPRLDGFELLERLRADPRTMRLPVIMLSAQAGEEATVEGLHAGADDYLVKPFSAPELLARVHANLEVVRLRHALAAGERDRARELENVALTLQRSLLPRQLPDPLGARLAGRYIPAGRSLEVGGDFYDATELGDGRIVIAIGDVAGHGVLAAAVMGQVRQALRAYALEGHPPAALITRLDRLVNDGELSMTTCLCGIFDPVRGRLVFSNAGHPPPLLRRADGEVVRVEGGLSHPLGVVGGSPHAQAEVQLEIGDALLLYTDGLVERRGESIDAGIERLEERLAAAQPIPDAVCDAIAGELAEDLADDAALLTLLRAPMADERFSIELDAHPVRLADLRRRLGAWLAAQGADPPELDDVVLATHEAAMNAVEHAYGPADASLTVVASRVGDAIEVEVADTGRWREPRNPQRGRGHGIMSALMDEVKIDTGPRGSTVRLRRSIGGGA